MTATFALPRSVRWIVWLFLFFMAFMSCLRLAFVLVFPNEAEPLATLDTAFFTGLRFDARVAAVVCLPVYLMTLSRRLHPLDSKLGEWLSYWLLTIFIFLLAVFYTVDGATFWYENHRLTGSIIRELRSPDFSVAAVWRDYPILIMLLSVLAIVSLLAWVLRLFYNQILSRPDAGTRSAKLVGSISVLLLILLAIWGSFSTTPLSWKDAEQFNSVYKTSVSLNPFQSFFSTLSERNAHRVQDNLMPAPEK